MFKLIYLTSESYLDHSYTIIKYLRKQIDLKVYLQAKELTAETEQWCKIFNAEFIKRRRFRNPLSLIYEFLFLWKIRKSKADAVLFNTMTIYQIILANLLLKNYQVILHDVDLHPESKDKHGIFSVKLTTILAKRCIAAASKTQGQLFYKQTGIKPKVYQLPIIDYYTDCADKNINVNFSKNYLENNKVKFFFFGSIEPYKGLEILLDAAEMLEKKELEFELTIYGRIKYSKNIIMDRIKNIVNTKIYDEYIDYKKIHSIYNINDVIILPYRQVTQCGPLLIAFNENVPAICSNLEGFNEYIDDGIDGIIFNNSAESLSEKMENIIKDRKIITDLKQGIIDNAKKKFSMEMLTNNYIENLKKTDK